MAEFSKWGATQVLPIIKHNMRRLKDGNVHGNKSIQSELTYQNYGLVHRGNTCKEINTYRKQIEKSCFQYKRKNLVHAIEIVIQCPSDCPDEQKERFFECCFEYVCSRIPLGVKGVYVSEVHLDEKHFAPDGTMLSKGHIHIMYVPAVPDNKHEGYDYKLCADAITKKPMLKTFHPELQHYLDKKGIQATVYHPRNGSSKPIGLSVDQLKQITQKTGIRIERTITTDRLSDILVENMERSHVIQKQQDRIKELENEILQTQKSTREKNSWETNKEWGNIINWGSSYAAKETEVEYDK